MRKFRSKMSKCKLSLSYHLPASPYFSNCDNQQHKLNNFEMAALESSHKLHGFCIQVKQKMKFQQLVGRKQLNLISFSLRLNRLDRSLYTNEGTATTINLFQFKLITIKSASKDLFTSPMHWVIPIFYPYNYWGGQPNF